MDFSMLLSLGCASGQILVEDGEQFLRRLVARTVVDVRRVDARTLAVVDDDDGQVGDQRRLEEVAVGALAHVEEAGRDPAALVDLVLGVGFPHWRGRHTDLTAILPSLASVTRCSTTRS